VLCVEQLSPDHAPPDEKWRFVRRTWRDVERDLRERAERYDHTRPVTTFLRYPGLFPVDVRHNSKIFREKLAVWATRQLA